jgi:hypothetical protein
MGSGHILVYAFDVLMQIYESQGYMPRDAAKSILEHNLYGLDIDDRAFQLAYFSIFMKARQYNRRILNGDTPIHVYAIKESNAVDRNQLEHFGTHMDDLDRHAAIEQMNKLLDVFEDAKIYGSILNMPPCDWDLLRQFITVSDQLGQMTFDFVGIEAVKELLLQLINVGEVLSQKYHIVVTNPPYMNSSYMPEKLKSFVTHNYTDFKNDLFSVFISKNIDLCIEDGHIGMLTPYVWMFIASYEKTRKYLLNHADITSLVQLEYNAFEAACVPVAAFTLWKTSYISSGEYIRLSDFKGVEVQPLKALLAVNNNNCGYRYTAYQKNFNKIDGTPIAYWVSKKKFSVFDKGIKLGEFAYPRQGLATANNGYFLKLWFEVDICNINFKMQSLLDLNNISEKWFPHNKGGMFKKWYGNRDFIINWQFNGAEIKNYNAAVVRNPKLYFKTFMSYSDVTSGMYSMRFYGNGFIFDSTGPSLFNNNEHVSDEYLLGCMNSVVVNELLKILCPTMHYTQSAVAKIPIINEEKWVSQVKMLVSCCLQESIADWDSFEMSWDFAIHPLLKCRAYSVDVEEKKVFSRECEGLLASFETWKLICNNRFDTLKTNEEELNRIFIDIYGLQDELTPDVADKDVTVARIYDTKENIPESMKGNNYVLTKQDVIKSLISYAVGCMFGRYSLDVTGLAFAGGDWDDSKYSTFIPDKDNVIPITDEDYFDDDIVGLFCAWLKKVYGSDTLEENLTFVAQALGNKGNTSRDIIRNYFLKDFFKDHVKTYKKRPIYWLFDSGKQNGFKALIYLHRYDENTIGNLRVDYLHRMERIYENEITRMQDMADNSTNAREATAAAKRKEKLQKQLKECKEYDEKISHLALARTTLDLDDGVKVNYEKVQTGKDGKKYEVLAKI